jgi:hypothetical protein
MGRTMQAGPARHTLAGAIPAAIPAAMLAVVVFAAGLLLSSCTSGSGAPPVNSSFLPSATRAEPGPVRHDAEPLTKRFAALGEPVEVTWRSGTTGDVSVPGPSTYWIDAAVRLAPAAATELRGTTGLTAVTLPADLPPDVLAAAGTGPWQTGDALNAAFGTAGFGTQAYLGPGDVVVLRAVGSGDAG